MISFNKPTISKKDLVSVLDCMINESVAENDLVQKFEKNFANFLNLKQSLIVNSSSAALYLILKNSNLKKGDEVILSALAPSYFLECLATLEIIPKVIDTKENSYLIDPLKLHEHVTPKTKAIIISHTLGYPVDFNKISSEILDRKNNEKIVIIEDCTQAFGTLINEKSVGTLGDYAFFSFEKNSIITAAGGAAILSKQKNHLIQLKDLRSPYDHSDIKGRFDFTLPNIQAAMGLSELSLAKKFISRRQEIGKNFTEASKRGGNFFIEPEMTVSFNFYNFPIQITSSLKIAGELFKKYKVQVIQPFDNILPTRLGLLADSFPNSYQLSLKTLSVPLYPRLKQKEINEISKLITSIR